MDLEATLSYADATKVPTNSQHPGIEYYFDRTWTGSATSPGGVTRTDSETTKNYMFKIKKILMELFLQMLTSQKNKLMKMEVYPLQLLVT